jgi:DNA-binding transcriptional regulator WhiA
MIVGYPQHKSQKNSKHIIRQFEEFYLEITNLLKVRPRHKLGSKKILFLVKSEEANYWLGFLIADANVADPSKTKGYSIDISVSE